jgi:TRAP-type C4-dicarboxylate transport system substrate-binding protein
VAVWGGPPALQWGRFYLLGIAMTEKEVWEKMDREAQKVFEQIAETFAPMLERVAVSLAKELEKIMKEQADNHETKK